MDAPMKNATTPSRSKQRLDFMTVNGTNVLCSIDQPVGCVMLTKRAASSFRFPNVPAMSPPRGKSWSASRNRSWNNDALRLTDVIGWMVWELPLA
jgi:hypothetical protein